MGDPYSGVDKDHAENLAQRHGSIGHDLWPYWGEAHFDGPMDAMSFANDLKSNHDKVSVRHGLGEHRGRETYRVQYDHPRHTKDYMAGRSDRRYGKGQSESNNLARTPLLAGLLHESGALPEGYEKSRQAAIRYQELDKKFEGRGPLHGMPNDYDLDSLIKAHKDIKFLHKDVGDAHVKDNIGYSIPGRVVKLESTFREDGHGRVMFKRERHTLYNSRSGKFELGNSRGPARVLQHFYPDGKTKGESEEHYDRGELHRNGGAAIIKRTYYPSGQLAEISKKHYKEGKLGHDDPQKAVAARVSYDHNGRLVDHVRKHITGPNTSRVEKTVYHSNGEKKSNLVQHLKDGEFHREDGPSTVHVQYERNGQIKSTDARYHRNGRELKGDALKYAQQAERRKSGDWDATVERFRNLDLSGPRRGKKKKRGGKPEFDPTVERFKRLDLDDPKPRSKRKEPAFDPTIERFKRLILDDPKPRPKKRKLKSTTLQAIVDAMKTKHKPKKPSDPDFDPTAERFKRLQIDSIDIIGRVLGEGYKFRR